MSMDHQNFVIKLETRDEDTGDPPETNASCGSECDHTDVKKEPLEEEQPWQMMMNESSCKQISPLQPKKEGRLKCRNLRSEAKHEKTLPGACHAHSSAENGEHVGAGSLKTFDSDTRHKTETQYPRNGRNKSISVNLGGRTVKIDPASFKFQPVVKLVRDDWLIQKTSSVKYSQHDVDDVDVKTEPVFFEESFSKASSSCAGLGKRLYCDDGKNAQDPPDCDNAQGLSIKKGRFSGQRAADADVGSSFPAPVTTAGSQGVSEHFFYTTSPYLTNVSNVQHCARSNSFEISRATQQNNIMTQGADLFKRTNPLHEDNSTHLSGYVPSGYKPQPSNNTTVSERKKSRKKTGHFDRGELKGVLDKLTNMEKNRHSRQREHVEAPSLSQGDMRQDKSPTLLVEQHMNCNRDQLRKEESPQRQAVICKQASQQDRISIIPRVSSQSVNCEAKVVCSSNRRGQSRSELGSDMELDTTHILSKSQNCGVKTGKACSTLAQCDKITSMQQTTASSITLESQSEALGMCGAITNQDITTRGHDKDNPAEPALNEGGHPAGKAETLAGIKMPSDSSTVVYEGCMCNRHSWFEAEEAEIWKTLEQYSASEKTLDNLGLLRFMGKNLFSFSKNGRLYVYLPEVKFRGLFSLLRDEVLFVRCVLENTVIAAQMRKPDSVELEYTLQYVENPIFSTDRSWMCRMITPLGLHLLYQALNLQARRRGLWSVHANSLFFTQKLGHHCQWTLQVTPPTCLDKEAPQSEASQVLLSQTVEKTLSRLYKVHVDNRMCDRFVLLTLRDGGAGTSLDNHEMSPSLKKALEVSLYVFGLEDIAEPFCSCDLNVTNTNSYRFLKVQNITFPQITHMHFGGSSQPLHCWKRNNGFFVNLQELITQGHMPARGHKILEPLLATAVCGSDFCFMLEPEKLFLRTLEISNGATDKSNNVVPNQTTAAGCRRPRIKAVKKSKQGRHRLEENAEKDHGDASVLNIAEGFNDTDMTKLDQKIPLDRCDVLLNLIFVRKMYRELVRTEDSFSTYADAKFYIKHWPHSCPTEQIEAALGKRIPFPEQCNEKLEVNQTECSKIGDVGDQVMENESVKNATDLEQCHPDHHLPESVGNCLGGVSSVIAGRPTAVESERSEKRVEKTPLTEEDSHEKASEAVQMENYSYFQAAENYEFIDLVDSTSETGGSDCDENEKECDVLHDEGRRKSQDKINLSRPVNADGKALCKSGKKSKGTQSSSVKYKGFSITDFQQSRQEGKNEPQVIPKTVKQKSSPTEHISKNLGYTVHLLRDGNIVEGHSEYHVYRGAQSRLTDNKVTEKNTESCFIKQEALDEEPQSFRAVKQEVCQDEGFGLDTSTIKKEVCTCEAEDADLSMIAITQDMHSALDADILNPRNVKQEVSETDEWLTEQFSTQASSSGVNHTGSTHLDQDIKFQMSSPHLTQCEEIQTSSEFNEHGFPATDQELDAKQEASEERNQSELSHSEGTLSFQMSDYPQSCSCPQEFTTEVLMSTSVVQSYYNVRTNLIYTLRHVGQAIIGHHIFFTFTVRDTLYFSLAQLQDVELIDSKCSLEEMNCTGCKFWLRCATDTDVSFLKYNGIKITARARLRSHLISAELLVFLSYETQLVKHTIKQSDIILHRVGHICPDRSSLARQQFGKSRGYKMVMQAWSSSFSMKERLKAVETKRLTGKLPDMHAVSKHLQHLVKVPFISSTKLAERLCTDSQKTASAVMSDCAEGQYHLYMRKFETDDLKTEAKENPYLEYYVCVLNNTGGTNIVKQNTVSEVLMTEVSQHQWTNAFEGAILPKWLKEKKKCLKVGVGIAELDTTSVGQWIRGKVITHHLILTGTLFTNVHRSNSLAFSCFQFSDKLYINWGELAAQTCGISTVYSLAHRLKVFLYNIPDVLSMHMARHSGGSTPVYSMDFFSTKPWLCVNSLNAMALLGSLDENCKELFPKTTFTLMEHFHDCDQWSVQLRNFVLIPKLHSVSKS